MPLYEYMREDGTKFEHIHIGPLEERPEEIDGAKLVPSTPGMFDFEAAYWRAQEAEGIIRVEPGTEKIADNAAKESAARIDQGLHDAAERAVRDHAFSASEKITCD